MSKLLQGICTPRGIVVLIVIATVAVMIGNILNMVNHMRVTDDLEELFHANEILYEKMDNVNTGQQQVQNQLMAQQQQLEAQEQETQLHQQQTEQQRLSQEEQLEDIETTTEDIAENGTDTQQQGGGNQSQNGSARN